MTLCYGRCTVDASVTAGAITRRIRDRARRLNATSNAAVPVATTRSTSNSRLPSPPSGLTCSQFSIQFTSSPLAYRQTGDRHYQCIRGEDSVATSELYGKFIRHSIGLLLTAIPRFPGLLGAILDLARGAQRNSIAADLSAAKTARRSAASRRNSLRCLLASGEPLRRPVTRADCTACASSSRAQLGPDGGNPLGPGIRHGAIPRGQIPLLGLLSAAHVCAELVGEIHRVTSEKTASLRDAEHRDQLRITVWYPAAADAVERPLIVGPPERPLRNIGSVAVDAAFAADRIRWPVILLSHGFGGTARIVGWFGIAMARDGYIVAAVDHPGNNAVDQMTVPGAALYWDRADDLRGLGGD